MLNPGSSWTLPAAFGRLLLRGRNHPPAGKPELPLSSLSCRWYLSLLHLLLFLAFPACVLLSVPFLAVRFSIASVRYAVVRLKLITGQSTVFLPLHHMVQ